MVQTPRVMYLLRNAPSGLARLSPDRPRFEFERFAERHGAVIRALTEPPQHAGRLGRTLRRGGMLGIALDFFARESASAASFVLTGEDIGLPAAIATWILRRTAPVHVIFHGHYIGNRKFTAVMRILRRLPHVHWHPLSIALRDTLIARFGVPERQCHATGYAVDTAFFSPRPGAGTVIASAGAAHRDYRTLIEASAGLGIPVKIAADSTWFPTRFDISGEAAPHVEARSYGNYAQLRELYADARFVVVPLEDREHACGYAVIAEAMAMGRAVIATRTRAPSDFLRDAETGLLVPPGDAATLRARMAQLLAEPELAARLGENARRRMEAFSLDRFCDRLDAAITASLAPSRGHSGSTTPHRAGNAAGSLR